MSSILKALKKLEEESFRQKTIHPWSSGMDKSRVNRSGFVSTRPFKVILALCLSIIILAMAGWLTTDKSPVAIKKNDEKPISFRQLKATAPPREDRMYGTTASNPAAEKQIIGKTGNDIPIPSRSIHASTTKSIPRSLTEPKMPSPDITSRSPELTMKRISNVLAPVIEKRKQDSRIKLQAIAWSHNPEKRMAVINDQIVREGSSIQGITVKSILEDQVIFREGDDTFRLKFGLE